MELSLGEISPVRWIHCSSAAKSSEQPEVIDALETMAEASGKQKPLLAKAGQTRGYLDKLSVKLRT